MAKSKPEPIYQPRCVNCGGEHYMMAVIAISHGQAGCHQCGHVPPVFDNEQEYRAALRAAYDRDYWGRS